MRMTSHRLRFAALAAVLGAAALLGEPGAQAAQEAQAADIQFWVTSQDPGTKCEECCFTGYCCRVPIVDC
ncbi:MAG TPA: hypothetical protein VFQ45_10650 [Longimicrobium sp.]|nr:hypothetical protein [Longimicrobium sp.]